MFEKVRKKEKHNYIYKAPLRGVGCSPRGDAAGMPYFNVDATSGCEFIFLTVPKKLDPIRN